MQTGIPFDAVRLPVALVVVAGLLAAGGAGTVALANADEGDLIALQTSIEPRQPAPEEDVTVTLTFRNLFADASTFRIEAITIREGETIDSEDLATDRSGLRLPPGESRTRSLAVQFDEPGIHEVYVHLKAATGRTPNVRPTYPLTVDVYEPHPSLDVEGGDAVANAATNLSVSVANGLDEPVRQAVVSVSGDGVRFDDPREVRSQVGPGEEATFSFAPVATEPGTHTVTAELTYTTGDGVRRTVTQTYRLSADPLEESVALRAERTTVAGRPAVNVTVENFGNAPLSDVVVRGEAEDAELPRAAIDRIPPRTSKTVTLRVSSLSGEAATVDVTAAYDVGERSGTAATATRVSDTPGTIRLTGVAVERGPGHVRVSGSASNVGLTTADSVVVEVVDTDRVEPVQPNREYFVGSVPASDFSSFDVTARTEGNVSAIPLRVTYLVDGERTTRTVSVDADVSAEPRAAENEGDDGSILPIVGGIAALVVVVALIVWRRRRTGGASGSPSGGGS